MIDIDLNVCSDIDIHMLILILLGAHITLLPQLKPGEERRGMEEVCTLVTILDRPVHCSVRHFARQKCA